MSGRSERAGTWIPSAATIVAVVVVLLLLAQNLWASETSGKPVIQYTVTFDRPNSSEVIAHLNLTSASEISVHVGLLSGYLAPKPRPIFVFFDPNYPQTFGTIPMFDGFMGQLTAALARVNASQTPHEVDATELPSVLAANPDGILVVVTGILPDTVLSNTSNILPAWLRAGGELIWAGGPLGYAEGQWSATAGFTWENLGWPAEYRITGFWLEDPLGDPLILPSGPLLGDYPTNWTKALGLQYNATMDGANVTQLDWHNGSILGYESVPNFPLAGASPRTSLAYVPIGRGSLYYFGGGYWAHDIGLLVHYPVFLASDIATIAACGFTVQYGPAFGGSFSLGGGGTVRLDVSLMDTTLNTTLIVSSEVGGIYLMLSEQNAPSR